MVNGTEAAIYYNMTNDRLIESLMSCCYIGTIKAKRGRPKRAMGKGVRNEEFSKHLKYGI